MNATIPDLNQPCPNCDHPLKFHDPEDGSCDVFSGDYKIGACPCGRRSQPVARHIPDDQVAWYAGTSRTAKWTAEMSTRVDIIALAREVQERRAADTERDALQAKVDAIDALVRFALKADPKASIYASSLRGILHPRRRYPNMIDRLSDERLDSFVQWERASYSPSEVQALAREVQERRAADTRTPSFTDDEMEAIRKALHRLSNMSTKVNVPTMLRRAGLSDSQVAWVLGDPSPAPADEVTIVIPGAVAASYVQCGCPSCGGEK